MRRIVIVAGLAVTLSTLILVNLVHSLDDSTLQSTWHWHDWHRATDTDWTFTYQQPQPQPGYNDQQLGLELEPRRKLINTRGRTNSGGGGSSSTHGNH